MSTVVEKDGQFAALRSFSEENSVDDASAVSDEKPRIRQKKKLGGAIVVNQVRTEKDTRGEVVGDEGDDHSEREDDGRTIERVSSDDSGKFQFTSCHDFMTELCGWDPDTIVVKVLSYARPPKVRVSRHEVCEPMPLEGMPKFILIGRVMSKTPNHCDISFGDRVLALLDEEFFSKTFTTVPYKKVVKVKKNLEPWQQISITLSYLPALHVLQMVPFTVEGNKVLLNGGFGPINQALIHLCIMLKARKIFVPVDVRFMSLVRGMGAKPMSDNHEDWGPELMNSIDVVVDSIGNNDFISSKAALKSVGHMVVTGASALDAQGGSFFTSMKRGVVDLRLKMNDQVSIFEYMKVYGDDLHAFEKDFKYLDKCVWDGLLPTLNTPLTPEQFEEGRKVHPVDGYMIVDIPHDGHWQT